MVFFFISFLVIIFLSCIPFSVRLNCFYSDYIKKTQFYIQIGFFVIKPKKNFRMKLKNNGLFSIKNLEIKKPIDHKIMFSCTYPENFLLITNILKPIIGVAIKEIRDVVDIDYEMIENSNDFLYLNADIRLKYNFYLIFSSILQTIKFGR